MEFEDGLLFKPTGLFHVVVIPSSQIYAHCCVLDATIASPTLSVFLARCFAPYRLDIPRAKRNVNIHLNTGEMVCGITDYVYFSENDIRWL